MNIYERAISIIREDDQAHFSIKAAVKIVAEFPDVDRYNLEAGFTPSGKVHLGNFGDILISESVRKVLEIRGYKARTILAIDSRDPFRKIPVFLPDEFKKRAKQYIGMPLETIPDPYGCHNNFVEHFTEPLIDSLEKYGLYPKIVFADQIHGDDRYVALLRDVIVNREKVISIFNRIHESAGHAKRYPSTWIPYRPHCKNCGRIDEKVTAIEVLNDGYMIKYKCQHCGYEGIADIRRAEGKPPWRVDWVMRWVLFNVHFEPMGKDLMAAGSSYDTGGALIRELFGRRPPVTIFYDFFYWLEPNKQPIKFSKRLGIGLGAHEWLKYAPPEALNYMLLKRHIGDIERDSLRHVDFSVYDIPKYVQRFDGDEEYSFKVLHRGNIESDERKMVVAYFLSLKDPKKAMSRRIRRVPYNITIEVALWMNSVDEGLKMLRRMKALPPDARKEEIEDAKQRLLCASNYIKDYWKPPEIDIEKIIESFSQTEKSMLRDVLEDVLSYSAEGISQEVIRSAIREHMSKYDIKPKDVYRMLYLVSLGKDTGPPAYRLFQKKFTRENLIKALHILKGT